MYSIYCIYNWELVNDGHWSIKLDSMIIYKRGWEWGGWWWWYHAERGPPSVHDTGLLRQFCASLTLFIIIIIIILYSNNHLRIVYPHHSHRNNCSIGGGTHFKLRWWVPVPTNTHRIGSPTKSISIIWSHDIWLCIHSIFRA